MTNLEKFIYNLIRQSELDEKEIVGEIYQALKVDRISYDDKISLAFATTIANLLEPKGKFRIEILKPHLWLNIGDRFGTFPKILCIKVIRKVFNYGLKEAKEESERENNLFAKETFQTKEEAQRWIDGVVAEMKANPYENNGDFLINFFEIIHD